MREIILIALAAALVNNVILSQFLGLCAFIGVSKKIDTAVGMGAAVIFVMTISSAVTSLIYNHILVKFGLEYLNTIVFILIIASLVQFVEMVIRKLLPALYKALGVYLPLITTNCAVLGIAIQCVQDGYGLVKSVAAGFGAAVGFTIAIVIMAGVREKTEYNDILPSFRGTPAVLLTAGLMAIAFYGFNGLM